MSLGEKHNQISSNPSSESSLHVPVQANGSDERADEGPGLRVAAGVKQRPPVVRTRNRFLQTAVAQQVGQTHFRVRHVLADAHLVRDGDAACGLAQVEGPGVGCESDEEQKAERMHDPDRGVEVSDAGAEPALALYRGGQMLSTTHQRDADRVTSRR